MSTSIQKKPYTANKESGLEWLEWYVRRDVAGGS